ncbi:MAG: hypothetical protein OXE17_08140 [Chloroflexi bacterium]|nr:hypothetical protein [Chloroflexota bacterium]
MKTYTLKVMLTPDEDGWFVRCPELESYGAATWGRNKEEAKRFIEEVLEMVVEEMVGEGRLVPEADEGASLAPSEYLVRVSTK